MTRIVTTTYRYKPPPRKRKTVPLAGPAVVTPKRKSTVAKKLEPPSAVVRKAKPCNDNHPEPEPASRPAIVTTTGRKRLKLPRTEKRATEPDNDPEATARVKAFLARMIRPGGALPPGKP